MNENRNEGKAKEMMGRVKEAAGSLFGKDDVKRDGQKDQVEGNVQQTAGDVEVTAKSAADAVTPDSETRPEDDTRRDR